MENYLANYTVDELQDALDKLRQLPDEEGVISALRVLLMDEISRQEYVRQ